MNSQWARPICGRSRAIDIIGVSLLCILCIAITGCSQNPLSLSHDAGIFRGGSPPCELADGVCQGKYRYCDEEGCEPVCTHLSYGDQYEKAENTCDGLDNDCNGVVDDLALSPVPGVFRGSRSWDVGSRGVVVATTGIEPDGGFLLQTFRSDLAGPYLRLRYGFAPENSTVGMNVRWMDEAIVASWIERADAGDYRLMTQAFSADGGTEFLREIGRPMSEERSQLVSNRNASCLLVGWEDQCRGIGLAAVTLHRDGTVRAPQRTLWQYASMNCDGDALPVRVVPFREDRFVWPELTYGPGGQPRLTVHEFDCDLAELSTSTVTVPGFGRQGLLNIPDADGGWGDILLALQEELPRPPTPDSYRQLHAWQGPKAVGLPQVQPIQSTDCEPFELDEGGGIGCLEFSNQTPYVSIRNAKGRWTSHSIPAGLHLSLGAVRPGFLSPARGVVAITVTAPLPNVLGFHVFVQRYCVAND